MTAPAVSPGTPPLLYSAPVDAMDLLSGISPPENEIAMARALLFGNRPVNDTVLSIASDELFQDDLIRLDGSFIPNEKKASDIWLNKKILACFRHFLIANDKNLCEQSPGRQPNYFTDSYLYMQMMQERREREVQLL